MITIWAVITVSFFLMRAVRGGPFSNERSLHPAIERNLQARYCCGTRSRAASCR